MTAFLPATSMATTVVPIPPRSASDWERSNTSTQAFWMAVSIKEAMLSRAATLGWAAYRSRIDRVGASAARIDFTACALATSPAAWPPIPSATT